MGLKLLHLNLHGLFRSHDLELGRDADTGGQTLYVLELLKGLASRPEVEKVELVTRLIQDRRVSVDYAKGSEVICPGASIVRIPFGPKRYLRKELLWPYLDDLADQLVDYIKKADWTPDWIHAHYADAGYVGALVSRRLDIPLVFTAHSLGREKQRRLLAGGVDHDHIEQSYCISRRIDAEELALAHADLVITSTKQEADQQYSRYDRYIPKRSAVVAPGVDSTRFHPENSHQENSIVNNLLNPFLRDPSLAPLLTISRAVRRKNIPALVDAFGRSRVLQQRHNLVLVLGCREDSRHLEKQQREVFQQIFDLVDKYNLYGKVAYPKQHRRDQIPMLYRWAANKKGFFVNPALTEPFGLTLLESSACGLPIVTTDDGGPREILSRCQNGSLTDVTDLESLQDSLEQAGKDINQWRKWSDNGIEAITRHFSWDAHVCNYLALMQRRLEASKNRLDLNHLAVRMDSNKFGNRLLLLDLDSNLECPERNSLDLLRHNLEKQSFQNNNCLGVLTGRSIQAARYRFSELHLPSPRIWICQAGTEIYYGHEEQQDSLWNALISHDWNRTSVLKVLSNLNEYISLQEFKNQSPYKVSYLLKEPDDSILPLIRKRLRQNGVCATPYLRCHWYLDILPLRASRTEAIRHLVLRWGIPLDKIFVVASQQGDADLLRGLISAVVPAEHDKCLESFRSSNRVFFASGTKLQGLLDGLNHYHFFSNK